MKTLLKMKICSLAAESRIIRREERKWPGSHVSGMRKRLYEHRKNVVGKETRASLIAYGFLRGRSYDRIEGKCKNAPDWVRVMRILKRFSPDMEQVWRQRFAQWIDEATLLGENFRPYVMGPLGLPAD